MNFISYFLDFRRISVTVYGSKRTKTSGVAVLLILPENILYIVGLMKLNGSFMLLNCSFMLLIKVTVTKVDKESHLTLFLKKSI